MGDGGRPRPRIALPPAADGALAPAEEGRLAPLGARDGLLRGLLHGLLQAAAGSPVVYPLFQPQAELRRGRRTAGAARRCALWVSGLHA